MEVFMDWKFYLFLMACLNTIVTGVAFLTIKFNDLRHLSKDVTEVKNELKGLNRKVTKIDKTVAVQTQRVDALEKSIS